MSGWSLLHGDCLRRLPELPEASVDAVVTDPPYGIGFMGHEWDQPGVERRSAGYTKVGARTTIGASGAVTAGSYDLSAEALRCFQAWVAAWARELLRVLKPGGHLVAFGAPRTSPWLAVGLADAGFEIRDQLMWLFGGGLPKSKNLARAHAGWGTALKPMHEPIVLARAPLAIRSVQRNAETLGTGALHIDACRVAVADRTRYQSNCSGDRRHAHTRSARDAKDLHAGGGSASDAGRWPANVLLAHEADCQPGACAAECVVRMLDECAGDRPPGSDVTGQEASPPVRRVYRQMGRHAWFSYGDHGGPARFFYSAKTSTAEREAGLHGRLPCVDCGDLTTISHPGPGGSPQPCRRNDHPTVKPLELMRWLCRLVTPPGGRVLDPFAGSDTTGAAAALERLEFVGIEREPWPQARAPQPYLRLARGRIAWWARQPGELSAERILIAAGERTRHEQSGQASIDELLTDAERAA